MIKLLSVDLDRSELDKHYRGMVAAKLAVHLWTDLYSHLPIYWTDDTENGDIIVYMEDKDYFNALIDPLIVNKDYPEVTPTIILMNILTNWNQSVKTGHYRLNREWLERSLKIAIPDDPIITFW